MNERFFTGRSEALFVGHINDLLDECILIGDGLTVHETLRPHAYSMLSDLINYVRRALTAPQIWKIIEIYTKNL